MKTLPAHESAANEAATMPSTILYKSALPRCFATKSFGVGQVIGIYYRSLVYMGMSEDNRKTKKYGKIVLVVTKKTFQNREIQVLGQVMARNGEGYTVWIMHCPNTSLQNVNHP